MDTVVLSGSSAGSAETMALGAGSGSVGHEVAHLAGGAARSSVDASIATSWAGRAGVVGEVVSAAADKAGGEVRAGSASSHASGAGEGLGVPEVASRALVAERSSRASITVSEVGAAGSAVSAANEVAGGTSGALGGRRAGLAVGDGSSTVVAGVDGGVVVVGFDATFAGAHWEDNGAVGDISSRLAFAGKGVHVVVEIAVSASGGSAICAVRISACCA